MCIHLPPPVQRTHRLLQLGTMVQMLCTWVGHRLLTPPPTKAEFCEWVMGEREVANMYVSKHCRLTQCTLGLHLSFGANTISVQNIEAKRVVVNHRFARKRCQTFLFVYITHVTALIFRNNNCTICRKFPKTILKWSEAYFDWLASHLLVVDIRSLSKPVILPS